MGMCPLTNRSTLGTGEGTVLLPFLGDMQSVGSTNFQNCSVQTRLGIWPASMATCVTLGSFHSVGLPHGVAVTSQMQKRVSKTLPEPGCFLPLVVVLVQLPSPQPSLFHFSCLTELEKGKSAALQVEYLTQWSCLL